MESITILIYFFATIIYHAPVGLNDVDALRLRGVLQLQYRLPNPVGTKTTDTASQERLRHQSVVSIEQS